jgi:ATP-dependent Clp protease ATP-binding subunit ClpC
MFERFTERARRVVVLAQEEASALNHNHIGTEHLLLGLVRDGEGVAARALQELEISLDAVREQVEEIIGRGKHEPAEGHIPFTPRAKKVLELSLREARQLGHDYIGTEHILLGIIREGDGVGAQVLVNLGGKLSRVRDKVRELVPPAGTAEGRAHAAPMRVVASSAQLEEIMSRLDTIAGRLAAIERHLGIEDKGEPAGGGEEPAGGG